MAIGRPKKPNAFKAILRVRVLEKQLARYKKVAKLSKQDMAEWVREILDRAADDQLKK